MAHMVQLMFQTPTQHCIVSGRFGLIRSYGMLGTPALAGQAFDEMRSLGIWQPTEVKTVNALLNAFIRDADEVYRRYSSLL